MADYDFYVNCYLGSMIPEKQFAKLAAQAASILEGYARSCRISSPGTDSSKFALCAMAECLLEHEKRIHGLHASNTNTCAQTVPLEKQLLQKARIYLDIYRGVD